MAGGPSVYMANRMLNKSLKGTDYTPPATMYLALFTTDAETALRANNVAGASEVANAGAYARMPITQGQISVSTTGSVSVTVDVSFAAASAPWGTVYQAAIMDASTHGAGNVLFFGPLSSSANVQSGDVLKIPANTLVVNL